MALAVLSLAPYMTQSTELVRLRHALLLQGNTSEEAVFSWTPDQTPADFMLERGPVDPIFADVAERLGLADMPDDWTRILAISAHLLQHPNLSGGRIPAGLRRTYRHIIENGDGYCGDFVRVFTALALAADIPVRNWAFAFDGFGGHGHIWAEIWNRQRKAWQLVDIFNNYYFSLSDGLPVSALEFRHAMQRDPKSLRLHALSPQARPGYAIESKAWDYYRRGLPQWYMWWGNNVFSYNSHVVIRYLALRSSALEQLTAVGMGIYPGLMVMAEPANAVPLRDLQRLRWHLYAAAIVMAAAFALMVYSGWHWVVARRGLVRLGASAGSSRPPATGDALGLRVGLVGPLPPPSGGMANQCAQLMRLLQAEGVDVQLVRTNADYQPRWVGQVPVVRAFARLVPYVWQLYKTSGRVDVLHILANSGWAWHLFATPAMAMARVRGTPVIINYRGGHADAFFSQAPRHVLRQLASAAVRVTPSDFLVRVFAKHGLDAVVVPNIIDLSRFTPRPLRAFGRAPHLIVTRNLEPIYDIPTAIRCLVEVRRVFDQATLTVAGSGPELDRLRQFAIEQGVEAAVQFTGRIDNADIPALYASADCVLNPSTVDNMPNSILEAFASGVPVVSTDAGGIPDVVESGVSGWLVAIGDHRAMAQATVQVLSDPVLAARLRSGGLATASRFDWPQVRTLWFDAYRRAANMSGVKEQA